MGFLFVILSQIMVATNIVCSKLVVPYVPVYVLLLVRYISSTVMLAMIAKARGESLFSIPEGVTFDKSDALVIFVQSVCAGFLFNALMLTGLNHTSGAVAGIITSTLPAIVVVMAAIFLKEKFGLGKWVAVSLATIGLIVINGANMDLMNTHQSFLGDVLIFLALIPEAAYYVMAKVAKIRLPQWMTITWINAINVVLTAPFGIEQMATHDLSHVPWWAWGIVVFGGLLTAAFFAFWSIGVKRVRMQLASLAPAMMPIAAVLLAWLILGETLSTVQLVGMILVIGSIFMCART